MKSNNQIWNERYLHEGRVWGDSPSNTVACLLKKLPENSRVIEFGCGYGRDLIAVASKGHRIVGYDQSIEGIKLAEQSIFSLGLELKAAVKNTNFLSVDHSSNSIDAIYSHRVLHLLQDDEIKLFVRKAYHVLRTGGLLYVSARNEDDFSKDQMKYIAPGVAVYKDHVRRFHQIKFWGNNDFIAAFGSLFKIYGFFNKTEVEACSNKGRVTNFTIMKAKK